MKLSPTRCHLGQFLRVVLSGADDILVNSGSLIGSVSLGSGNVVYDGALGSVTGYIYGGNGVNTLTGGAGTEKFSVTRARSPSTPAAAMTAFWPLRDLTSSQQIDGGAGNDTVQISGDYSAGLVFTDTTMVNVERLVLGAGYAYSLTMDDFTVAAGQRLAVNGSAATSLTLDASAETDGYYSLIGGSGADTFIFDAADFSRFDAVQGGAGAVVDTLQFSTAGTLSASALANVRGIERISLAVAGASSVTLTDALVGSANNALVTVTGGNGNDVINAAAVSSPHRVQFRGGAAPTL